MVTAEAPDDVKWYFKVKWISRSLFEKNKVYMAFQRFRLSSAIS